MLTSAQVQSARASLGINPTPQSTVDRTAALDKAWGNVSTDNTEDTTPVSETSQLSGIGNNMEKSMSGTGQDVIDNTKRALGSDAADQNDEGSFAKNFAGDLTARLASLGHVAGDTLVSAFTPLTTTLSALIPPEMKDDYQKGVNYIADKITNNPQALKLLQAANHIGDSNPDLATSITKDIPGVLGVIGGAETGDTEVSPTAAKSAIGTIGDDVTGGIGKIQDIPSKISSGISDTASDVINKVNPSEPIDATIAKVLQGKTGDLSSGRSALLEGVKDENGATVSKPLDTTNVKTYKDLSNTISQKIKEVAGKQDERFDQDTTPHQIDEFDKTVGEGKNTVTVNYVKEALDNLKELYTSSKDAEGISKIKDLEDKVNGVIDKSGNMIEKPVGLTSKEINQLARDYGSEFNSKAFSKVNGDPLTSVNAQRFENIRTGLKDTARDFMPDKVTQDLDNQMSDLYSTKKLSDKMVEKVNAVINRLQSKNFLQKAGAVMGKLGKITGVGDVAKELLGLDNTPGASTLNPVEIQERLPKLLGRINNALEQGDAGFASSIKDIISHPK